MFRDASWKGLWGVDLLCRLTAWGLGGWGGHSPALVPLQRRKGRKEREREPVVPEVCIPRPELQRAVVPWVWTKSRATSGLDRGCRGNCGPELWRPWRALALTAQTAGACLSPELPRRR